MQSSNLALVDRSPDPSDIRPHEQDGNPSSATSGDLWGSRMRVLLVEDDIQDVQLLRAKIGQDGLRTHVAITHVTSLEAAGRQLPGDFDVALLDLGLPDSNGLQTYERLMGMVERLPVVVLSGDTNHELAVAAVRQGAQDYLVKGHVSGDALLRVLRYAIERGQVRERERTALRQQREAAERLRELDTMKDTFLQAVSHELRTPLAAIYGYARTLQDNGYQLDEPQGEKIVERLAVNADRLRVLLDDLMDVNRLAAGVLEIQPQEVDLADLARAATEQLEMSDHRLITDLQPVAISAEPGKIERIIYNLLNNAVKHTPAGTTIWLTTDQTDNGAVITVEDDGPGIDDGLKPTVFDAFRQGATSKQDASPGTGIGLNLVAKFAQIHGGRAWVEDRPGGGARFQVLLDRVDRNATQGLQLQARPADPDDPVVTTVDTPHHQRNTDVPSTQATTEPSESERAWRAS